MPLKKFAVVLGLAVLGRQFIKENSTSLQKVVKALKAPGAHKID